ncbi:DAZ protein 1-like [Stegodyphus dumicola]|uniref:DAZ protein 1-like n=1 Tax=Stegodyphus dumicola TaxID=202533 RepID=UPI0015A88BAB|nr:DAZ protein 1-like [Stegodyphus dumicola]
MATGGRDDSRGINVILKNGTAVPNRIFVGGISGNTNEDDLKNLFSKFGNVKATKVIIDKAGISKGYGFVTFETEEEAQKVLIEVDCLTLKDRKLNIAPAVKKQPYNRISESNSMHNNPIVWPAPTYSGSTGYPRESVLYPQPTWPFVWPQHFYLQQQCHYPPAQTGYPQYMYPVAPEYPFATLGQVSATDFSETSSADSGESGKNRSKPITSTPVSSDYERNRISQVKTPNTQNTAAQRYPNGNMETPYVHTNPFHHIHHPVLAKTVNGVAIMAYPSSFLMSSPAIVHLKDGPSESDNVLAELGFIHSPISSGALTPPPTPLASMPCDFNANTSMDLMRKN